MSQPDRPPSTLGLHRAADRARVFSAARASSSFGSILGVAAVTLLILRTASIGVAPDTEFQECWHCPIMEGIPAGKFLMGSPKNEVGRFASEARNTWS